MARRPLLLGHRGCRNRRLQALAADLPLENSVSAFEYAISRGCDGIEFDVRHTRDGHNVIWHEAEWKGKEIATADNTDLVDGDGSHLATLEKVVSQFGDRAYLDIELKVSGGEGAVVTALRANPPRRGFIVTSFCPEILLRLHDLDGKLPIGFICDRPEAVDIWRDLPVEVILPRHDLVRPRFTDEVHGRGQQIMTWTVNSSGKMLQLAEWGIDGLISDDPQLLCRTFHTQ